RTRPAIAGPPSFQTAAYPVERMAAGSSRTSRAPSAQARSAAAVFPQARRCLRRCCGGSPVRDSSRTLEEALCHEGSRLPRTGLRKLWIQDVTITTGLVATVTTPILMQLIELGKLDPTLFATHRFALDDTMAAYDRFSAAAE